MRTVKQTSLQLVLLLLTTACLLPAQQPEITPDMHPTTSTLHEWLESGDPRLIAWAADFARRTHDASLLAKMPSFLEHAPMPATTGARWGYEYRHSLEAILNALIDEHVPVSTQTVRAIAAEFPAQAAILALHLPANTPSQLREQSDLMNQWFRNGENGYGTPMLTRIAAMHLAEEPTPEFVEQIVTRSELRLEISIVEPGHGFGASLGSSCGDNIGLPLDKGWPQVYTYHLSEHSEPTTKTMEYETQLLDLAGDRIVFERTHENAPWGACTGVIVEPLNSTTRHRLIAYWLGKTSTDMLWQPQEKEFITWENRHDYEQELSNIVEARRGALTASVDALVARNLIRKDHAGEAQPRLVLNIACRISPCPLGAIK